MALVYTLRRLHDDSPAWLRRAGATALGRLPARWKYGRAFRTTWDLLHRADGWTAAERTAHQMTRLRGVLELAGRCVPYYRRLFDERGFDPARVREVSDLSALPLLTRDDVKRLDTELLPDGRPPAESKYLDHGWNHRQTAWLLDHPRRVGRGMGFHAARLAPRGFPAG